MAWHTDAARPEVESPRRDTRLRVLVVDDNADLARLLTLLLQHCGFTVQTLLSSHTVLATARSFRPHFILLDIGLPGLDGYQVAEQIRSDPALKSVCIIAISAYGPSVHPERAQRANFNHHLVKPVYLDDLLPLMVPSSINQLSGDNGMGSELVT